MMGAPTRFPAHCRMYAVMRAIRRPVEIKELPELACVSAHHAWVVAKDLHECGLIHIAGWREVAIGGGHPAKLYAFGFGEDVPKPARKDSKAIRRNSYYRRKKAIIQSYGYETWKRIKASRALGGSDKIVLGGKIIFQRAAPVSKLSQGATP